jgi:drug/metabolite transporter (DMT)-like permease
MHGTPLAYFSFALVALIWGTTWVAIKFSLEGFPPFAGAMLRFLIAIAALYFYARYKKISLALPRTATGYVIVTSILLYVVDYGLIYWAEQYLSSGVTAIFFAALPLATASVSTFAFKSESWCYKRFVGILVGLIGVVIVFFDQVVVTSFDGKVMAASLAVLTAAIAAAVAVVLTKQHLMTLETVPLTIHQLIWGTLGLGVIAIVRGEFADIRYSNNAAFAVVYLGLAGSALAFVIYYKLLRTMTASTLSTITYITPLVAVFTGWLLLNESITMRAVLGAATIFLGITIIQFDYLANALRRTRLASP